MVIADVQTEIESIREMDVHHQQTTDEQASPIPSWRGPQGLHLDSGRLSSLYHICVCMECCQENPVARDLLRSVLRLLSWYILLHTLHSVALLPS